MSLRTFDSEVINLRTFDGETLYDIIESDVIDTHTSTPSSALEMADGTAAAPGLYFDSDVDTGFYRLSANTLGISTAGALAASFAAAGFISKHVIKNASGSAGSPSYTFEAETNTGMYWDVGTIGFSRNGISILTMTSALTSQIHMIIDSTNTEALLIRKDGDTGDIFTVDTSTPLITCGANMLLPSGTAAAPSIRLNDTDTGIFSSITGQIDFTCNGGSRISINGNGDLLFTSQSRGLITNNYVGTFIIQQGVSNQKLQLRKVNDGGGIGFSTDNGVSDFALFQAALSTFQCALVIDTSTAEALLIRQNGDTGDIFTVDTSTPLITAGATFVLPAGSAAAPSLRFSDTGTGLYRTSLNRFAITSAGVQQIEFSDVGTYTSSLLQIKITDVEALAVRDALDNDIFVVNSTQPQVLFPQGTVSSPGLAFHGDANTGFYSVADDIYLSLAGVNRMSFTTSLASIEVATVIDLTGTEAFLVRKNADGGDIFTVDTTNERTIVNGITPELYIGNGTTTTQADLNFYMASGQCLIRTYEGATLRSYIGYTASTGVLGLNNAQANKPIVLATNGTSTDICFSNDQGSTYFATFRTSSSTLESSLAIDIDSANALRVRKNGALGDVFVVDTVSSLATCAALTSTGVITANGASSQTYTYGYLNSAGATGTTSGTTTYSVIATNKIKASEFHAVSSKKIKTIQASLDDADTMAEAIALFESIPLSKYVYTDSQIHDSYTHYGLIAEDMPNGIYTDASQLGYVPNIFAFGEVEDVDEDGVASIKLKDKEIDIAKLTNLENLLVFESEDNGKTFTKKEALTGLSVGKKALRGQMEDQKPRKAQETRFPETVVDENGNESKVDVPATPRRNRKGSTLFIYGTQETIPNIAKNNYFELAACVVKSLLVEVDALKARVAALES